MYGELKLTGRTPALPGFFYASIFFNSPLEIKACTSVAPPTNTPFTNTMGKVGQPVHILSALRSRQVLK